MTDHHDFGDHHHDDYYPDPAHHDEPLGYDEPAYDDHGHYDDPGHFDDHHPYPAEDHHDPGPAEPPPSGHDVHPLDDTPHHLTAALTDGYHDPADLFPPPVDVGDLPEPVDGFPWTDATTLGTGDLATRDAGFPPVHPHELAEYAGTELPEGVDPWSVLAASDDPATNTLARFWHDTGE